MSAITTDHPDVADDKEQASDVSLINVPRVLLVIALLPFIAMKLAYVFAMPVLPDEGYYWMWGQNLALSYYDHPPLLAWLQGLSHAVFGSTIFSLRLVPMLAFGGMVWIAWDWCKRLAPEGRAVDALLITLIVWLASPLLLRYTTLGIQDCLLIAFTMASIHFAALFMMRRDETDREDWRLFFAACVFVGLAGLSKYNAVFIAAGFALYLLCTASGRSLLSRWQIWAGLALIAAMQAPTLVWNIQNGWPSMQFYLSDRIGQTRDGATFLTNFTKYLTDHVHMGGIGLVLLMVRFAYAPGFAHPIARIGMFVMLVSTLVFAALTYSNTIFVYWNIVAFAAVMPAVAFLMRQRWELLIHIGYGLWAGIWYMMAFGLYPLNAASGGPVRDVDIQYGMREIGARLEVLESEYKPDVLMTSDYRTAGMLGFTLDRNDIQKIGPRNDQYDFWFDPEAMKGKTALVLVDEALPETNMIADVFETVTTVSEFTINRFGYDIHTWRVVLAENHCGCGPH